MNLNQANRFSGNNCISFTVTLCDIWFLSFKLIPVDSCICAKRMTRYRKSSYRLSKTLEYKLDQGSKLCYKKSSSLLVIMHMGLSLPFIFLL